METWLVLGFTFVLAFGGTALLVAPSEAERLARLRVQTSMRTPADQVERENLAEPLAERLFGPLMRRLRAALYARTPAGMRQLIVARLAAAGRPADVGGLLSRKALLAMLFALLFWWVLSQRGATDGLLGAAFAGFVGWRFPDFSLARATARRRAAIARVLPDALDLLCTSVEAGLGLDAAIQRVAEKLGGALGEELALYLRDVRLGRSREDALHDVAERTGVAELRSALGAILQAERLGASLARVLRVQAADLRVRRRLRAQEKAMQMPIKLLLPLVLFVFPALFVVVLGPAALQVMQNLRTG